MTDFLSYLANTLNVFGPIIPILERGMRSSGENRIIDLGSGAGGGWVKLSALIEELSPKTEIFLTDYFPNLDRINRLNNAAPNLRYREEPIDAREVPQGLKGLRTMFLAFHHFKPTDARGILHNSVKANQPIAIFEGQERSLLSLIGMVFSPITLLITTPFIRPFRLKRLAFTYFVPILPLLVLWDGVVSCLRTYSVEELRELVLEVEGGERFNWEINTLRSGPGVILYLLGTPKENAATQ